MALNCSPELKVVIVQIALVATLFKLSNIPMKFKRNWPRGIGGVGVLRFFYV